MPGTYGTHALPLVLGSDRPCDAGTTLCALRDRINTLLTGYEDTISTVVNNVPAARLSRPAGSAVLLDPPPPEGDILVPFTTVEFDNANMTNLSQNARIITIPRLGRYWITGYIEMTTRSGGTIFDQQTIFIEGGLFNSTTPRNTVSVRAPSQPNFAAHISDLRGGFEGDQIALRLNPETTAGSSSISIVQAQLTVWWHSDYEP